MCLGSYRVNFINLFHRLQLQDGPECLALVHEIEGFVDLVERSREGDELVQHELTREVLVHQGRNAVTGLPAYTEGKEISI